MNASFSTFVNRIHGLDAFLIVFPSTDCRISLPFIFGDRNVGQLFIIVHGFRSDTVLL